MKPRLSLFRCSIVVLVSASLFGCGYHLQGASNPWASRGIHKVYVKMLLNRTLRTGIETIFTSALVKEFARGKRLELVASEKAADVILEGSLVSASSSISSSTTVSQISTSVQAAALDDMSIASEYLANAQIEVRLRKSGESKSMWSGTFTRNKVYPANNRFGLQGSTSALINSSQEQIAWTEIAQLVASDAYDTMLEGF